MRWIPLLTLAIWGCNAPEVNTSLIDIPATGAEGQFTEREVATLEPDERIFRYDTVVEGAVITHAFTFRNTGNAPLLIADVSSGCGCTVPKNWPRELIPPGGKGTIEVAFNTRGWSGDVDKRVTAVTNGEPSVVHLVLDGHILAPSEVPEPAALPITRH
jgi:hypothetical protein